MSAIKFSPKFLPLISGGSKRYTTRFSSRFDGDTFTIDGVLFRVVLLDRVLTVGEILTSIVKGVPTPFHHGFSSHAEMIEYWRTYIVSTGANANTPLYVYSIKPV